MLPRGRTWNLGRSVKGTNSNKKWSIQLPSCRQSCCCCRSTKNHRQVSHHCIHSQQHGIYGVDFLPWLWFPVCEWGWFCLCNDRERELLDQIVIPSLKAPIQGTEEAKGSHRELEPMKFSTIESRLPQKKRCVLLTVNSTEASINIPVGGLSQIWSM